MSNKIHPFARGDAALGKSGRISGGVQRRLALRPQAGHPMLSRCSTAFILAAAMLVPLQGAECLLDSTPTPLLAGGLAEPLGDLVLRCSLGAPGTALQGFLLL